MKYFQINYLHWLTGASASIVFFGVFPDWLTITARIYCRPFDGIAKPARPPSFSRPKSEFRTTFPARGNRTQVSDRQTTGRPLMPTNLPRPTPSPLLNALSSWRYRLSNTLLMW